MTPCFPKGGATYRFAVNYANRLSDFRKRQSVCEVLANPQYESIGQFGAGALLSRPVGALSSSTLAKHVLGVVVGCPEKQMVGIYAKAVVAMMEHPQTVWNSAKRQPIGHYVRPLVTIGPIACLVAFDSAKPTPASVGFLDSVPKLASKGPAVCNPVTGLRAVDFQFPPQGCSANPTGFGGRLYLHLRNLLFLGCHGTGLLAAVAVLFIVFPSTVQPQVRILATPEPMAVMQSLGMRTLGLWSISLCNDTASPVTISRERVILALPAVRIVSTERARAALAYAQGRTWQARAAGVMRWGLMGSTVGAALAGTNKQVIAGLAVGALLADQVARRLENEIPRLDPWVAGLSDEALTLGPGQCGSRTVFAALQRGAKVTDAVIE